MWGHILCPLESLKSPYSSQALCFNFICVQRWLFCITILVKDISMERNPIFFSRSRRRSPPSIHPKCCQTVIWIRKQWFWQGILSRNKSKPGQWRQAAGEEHQKRKQWGHSVVTTKPQGFLPYSVFHKYWPHFNVEQPRAACMNAASLTKSFNQL